jgi:phosphinothricin acetyltransferase
MKLVEGSNLAERVASYKDDPRAAATLVAEAAEAVVGYAYAGPYRPRPAYRWSVEDSVYIAPQAHRRGIGRALLLTAFDALRRRGIAAAELGVDSESPTGATRLYESVGMRTVRASEWWQKRLTPA